MINSIVKTIFVLSAALLFSCGKGGYQQSSNGLQYKIFGGGSGSKAVVGNIVLRSNVLRKSDGTMIFSNKDIYSPVLKPAGKGDPVEIFSLMSAGDSASVKLKAIQIFVNEAYLPEGVKKDDVVYLDIKINKILTTEEYAAIKDEIAPSQLAIEKKLLENWFVDNKLEGKVQQTESGLYYAIETQGNGAKPKAGDKLKMNYTGTLLDGTKFDSNVDPAFGHVTPFEFTLGQGQVIKGWDEGIPLFNVGGKGKLIIPARLGYGSQRQAKIPANSTLVFDIQVLGAN